MLTPPPLAMAAAVAALAAFPAAAQETEASQPAAGNVSAAETAAPAGAETAGTAAADSDVSTDAVTASASAAEAEVPAEVEAVSSDVAENGAEEAVAEKVEAGPVTEASPADFRTGMQVRDSEGALVGTVISVDGEGAIVFTGNLRAKLPFQSFGKNNLGLVISLSRAELEAAASAQDAG